MPKRSTIQHVIKILNYTCAVMMFITASIRYKNYDSKAIFMDGFYLVFTFYLYIFGILLSTAEYEYIKVLKYIEFLVTNTGKGSFLIFIGILLFDDTRAVDLWGSMIISLVGIFNIIVSCMKPVKQERFDDRAGPPEYVKPNLDESDDENDSLLSYYEK